ncbi:MAG: hypothetical protein QXS02_04590 [Candidatus Thermoplasmatota archaeon]
MKYRDIITLFAGLGLILSVAYTLGVDNSVWYVPVVLSLLMILIVWKLWL